MDSAEQAAPGGIEEDGMDGVDGVDGVDAVSFVPKHGDNVGHYSV